MISAAPGSEALAPEALAPGSPEDEYPQGVEIPDPALVPDRDGYIYILAGQNFPPQYVGMPVRASRKRRAVLANAYASGSKPNSRRSVYRIRPVLGILIAPCKRGELAKIKPVGYLKINREAITSLVNKVRHGEESL